MTVDALLCDAATVREGMLHVLGGGVTRIWRPAFPAPLGLSLALLVTLEPAEARQPHKLTVILQDQDGQVGAQLDGQFGVASPTGAKPGERLLVPVVLNLLPVAIPKAGTYSLELLIDGHLERSLAFVAGLPTASGQRPPSPGGRT
jgi:hypothetical protein